MDLKLMSEAIYALALMVHGQECIECALAFLSGYSD